MVLIKNNASLPRNMAHIFDQVRKLNVLVHTVISPTISTLPPLSLSVNFSRLYRVVTPPPPPRTHATSGTKVDLGTRQAGWQREDWGRIHFSLLPQSPLLLYKITLKQAEIAESRKIPIIANWSIPQQYDSFKVVAVQNMHFVSISQLQIKF